MNTHITVWDIETGPDISKAKSIMPAFEESEVKTGNLGPDKAREKIESARANHEADFLDKAALFPETGKVLAIGIKHCEEVTLLHVNANGGEANLLKTFWMMVEESRTVGNLWMGWNIFQFDLSFLVIRSHILGVRVPAGLRRGRYWESTVFCDLMEEWLMGRNRQTVRCSLGYVARALGVGEKSGDGKDFAATYAQDEAKALAYLRNDIALTAGVGAKIGF